MLGVITPVFKIQDTPRHSRIITMMTDFKLISKGSMNHIRYVFYWEAYEKNPSQFVKEIKKVTKTRRQVGTESCL